MAAPIGKEIIDLAEVLEQFEAQEGEVQHIIGKTGQGKTYEATRRAAQFLFQGYTVYTTWKMHVPDYYDEREHIWPIIRNLVTFRREFFRFDLKNNYKYIDLRTFEDEEGIFNTEKFSRYLAALTDCIFMLDEGQDVFDSHSRAGKIARQTITRTRHMHKTLIVISQRAQAVDVTARGNVTYFYKCEKLYIPLLGYRFRVYVTDEIDEGSNQPIWVRHNSQGKPIWKAPVYHSAFAKRWIYDMYDSWYMRQQQIRSQDIKLEAFNLTAFDRLRVLWRAIFTKKVIPISEDIEQDNAIIPVYGMERKEPTKILKLVKVPVVHAGPTSSPTTRTQSSP
jgi:hypothetical protein